MFDKKLGQSFRLSHTFLQLTQEITEIRTEEILDIQLTISHQQDHMESACTKLQRFSQKICAENARKKKLRKFRNTLKVLSDS